MDVLDGGRKNKRIKRRTGTKRISWLKKRSVLKVGCRGWLVVGEERRKKKERKGDAATVMAKLTWTWTGTGTMRLKLVIETSDI